MARNEKHFVTIRTKFKFFSALSPARNGVFLLSHTCKTVFRLFKLSGPLHIKSFFHALTATQKGAVLVVFRTKKDLKMPVAVRADMATIFRQNGNNR